MTMTPSPSQRWPGERLGLPETGSGSVARLGRRVAALAIDWGIALLLSAVFFGYDSLATLGIYVLLQVITVAFVGSSVGHRLLGLEVVRLAGGQLGVLRPLGRAVLIAVVIPAVIWDADQRGMHDRWMGTLLRRR